MHPSIQIFFFAIPRYTSLRSALGTERGEGNLFCSPDHGECFAKQNVSNHQGERWRGSCTTFLKLFFVSYISVSKWIPFLNIHVNSLFLSHYLILFTSYMLYIMPSVVFFVNILVNICYAHPTVRPECSS